MDSLKNCRPSQSNDVFCQCRPWKQFQFASQREGKKCFYLLLTEDTKRADGKMWSWWWFNQFAERTIFAFFLPRLLLMLVNVHNSPMYVLFIVDGLALTWLSDKLINWFSIYLYWLRLFLLVSTQLSESKTSPLLMKFHLYHRREGRTSTST